MAICQEFLGTFKFMSTYISDALLYFIFCSSIKQMNGSPDLVVTVGDPRSRGSGLESQRWILDGHFSHLL